MREKYESLGLVDLKEIAKHRGMKGVSTMKKSEVIEAMLALDEQEKKAAEEKAAAEVAAKPRPMSDERIAVVRTQPEPRTVQEQKDRNSIPSELDSGMEANGILEVLGDGFRLGRRLYDN